MSGLQGLPGSPVLIGLAAVVLAAVAIFFLPQLLGIGKPQTGSNPSPSVPAGSNAPSGSPEASSEASATASAGATPHIYVVVGGDTMSKVARKFGIPLQVLVDANKDTVPNPNSLKIGQQIVIPDGTPTSVPAASGTVVTAAPSP